MTDIILPTDHEFPSMELPLDGNITQTELDETPTVALRSTFARFDKTPLTDVIEESEGRPWLKGNELPLLLDKYIKSGNYSGEDEYITFYVPGLRKIYSNYKDRLGDGVMLGYVNSLNLWPVSEFEWYWNDVIDTNEYYADSDITPLDTCYCKLNEYIDSVNMLREEELVRIRCELEGIGIELGLDMELCDFWDGKKMTVPLG